jgi:hypothetical protein
MRSCRGGVGTEGIFAVKWRKRKVTKVLEEMGLSYYCAEMGWAKEKKKP